MSLKTKTFRLLALSVISAPAVLFAAEPRIIIPTKAPTKVVFEQDNATYDVLNRFRNARSSEQIHFQAIETLFPRVPDRESVREGYSMVKEIVDAKKAAIQAASELEAERARLEAARVELEAQAQLAQTKVEEAWEVEPQEFDYYEFEADVQPEPQPSRVATTHQPSRQVHTNNRTTVKKKPQRRSWTASRKRGGRSVRH